MELDVDGLLAPAAESDEDDTPMFVASFATLAGADASQGVALFLNNSRAWTAAESLVMFLNTNDELDAQCWLVQLDCPQPSVSWK